MAEPTDQKRHLFDDPANVRRAIWALVTVSVLSVVAELFIHRHVDHPWEALFGFYAVYGFVACVLLVLAAKEMRKALRRGEEHYDE